jgi:hypothetical protein
MLRKTVGYVFSGILPYLILTNFFPENPEIILIPEVEENLPDIPTGIRSKIKGLVKSRAFKVSLIALFSTILINEGGDRLILTLIEASPNLLAEPNTRLGQVVRRLRSIMQPSDTLGLSKIILSKYLSKSKKIELVRKRVEDHLKGLTGVRRTAYLGALLASLMFILDKDTSLFLDFFKPISGYIGSDDVQEPEVIGYFVSLHKEYNAPMPQSVIFWLEDNFGYYGKAINATRTR